MNEALYDWLAAREAVDVRFRSRELAAAFATAVAPSDTIVDLGCGTGANFRFLDPYLSPNQKWLGIDVSAEILSQAADCLPRSRVTFETLNLATNLLRVPFRQGAAITASAFLDLVSIDWLHQLARHSCEMAVLIAMSTTSQPVWDPVDALDEPIRSRLELHQRSDHGFGPSIGPEAVDYLAEQFRSLGCRVTLHQSDWILDSGDQSFIERMIVGVARRVQSMPEAIDAQGWAKLRRDQLERGELRVQVKHVDLLSVPKRTDERTSTTYL